MSEAVCLMIAYHRFLISKFRPKTLEPSQEDTEYGVDVPKLVADMDALDQRLRSLQIEGSPKDQDDLRLLQRVQWREARKEKEPDSEPCQEGDEFLFSSTSSAITLAACEGEASTSTSSTSRSCPSLAEQHVGPKRAHCTSGVSESGPSKRPRSEGTVVRTVSHEVSNTRSQSGMSTFFQTVRNWSIIFGAQMLIPTPLRCRSCEASLQVCDGSWQTFVQSMTICEQRWPRNSWNANVSRHEQVQRLGSWGPSKRRVRPSTRRSVTGLTRSRARSHRFAWTTPPS